MYNLVIQYFYRLYAFFFFFLDYMPFKIITEISPEYSLEGLRLKLKFQYFGHLMQRADSLEKILREELND